MPATPIKPPIKLRIVIALLWTLFVCLVGVGWWLLLFEGEQTFAFALLALSVPVLLTAERATRWQRREVHARLHAEGLASPPPSGGGTLSNLLGALWP